MGTRVLPLVVGSRRRNNCSVTRTREGSVGITEADRTTGYEQIILEQLRHFPPARLAEVEDFVDFLAHRQTDERGLTQAAGQLATGAFTRIWDNPADADYDR